MMYRRYGKFNFKDYYSIWFGICVMLLLSIFAFAINTSFILKIIPIAMSVVWIFSVLYPYCECFFIDEDVIYVKKGRRTERINITLEPILIISYVGIREVLETQSVFLKDKYAVSIIKKMPLEYTIEKLHQNYVKRYTTQTIENRFRNQYIYSFVYDETLLNEIIQREKCVVIIPESLTSKVVINKQLVNVYIDFGY